MQLNKKQVVEVNLRDLFFHLLYRWRSILIAALIGALVFCAYQYLSVKKTHDEGKLTKEERQYELDYQAYQEDTKRNQDLTQAYMAKLESMNTYQKESLFFNMDPKSIWYANRKYLIKADSSVYENLPQGFSADPVDSVLSVYASLITEIPAEEWIDIYGTDNMDYISEMITVYPNASDNTLTIGATAGTEEIALKARELLHKTVNQLSSGRAQEIEPHIIIMISELTELSSDDALITKQNSVADLINETLDMLQETRKNQDELEAKGEPGKPSLHLIKMSILGIIFGAIILACYYAVLYITRGKLNNSQDMTERYNLHVLGDLMTSGQLHADKGIDKVIARFERGKQSLDPETVYDNIGALIADKQGIGKLVLVSPAPQENLTALQNALAERLPDKTVETQGDMLRNSTAITESSKADAVLLVVEKHRSGLKEIDRIAEDLIISEANVIGAIVL